MTTRSMASFSALGKEKKEDLDGRPSSDATLPLVKCPCCGSRTVVRLVSRSTANPGRVFFKCPNHQKGPQGCNFFHWEDGEDSYMEYLALIGVSFGSVVVSAAFTATEVEEAVGGNTAGKSSGNDILMRELLSKMEEIISFCRMVLVVFVLFLAMMLYVVSLK
ncbi:hypothetical protein BRADI_2g37230v3 [Brachypodium distachyon]|uniref:GRF-type domain-containing protein n=1 Tax=Brachypodium distachyon TaxID=15368 RepID=I1HMA4_BRADI|nr:hypothetical protein BRADI_2g37230v3 [Brachypodium distachyon]